MPIVYVVTLNNGKREIVELDTDVQVGDDEDIEGGGAMVVYQTDDCVDGGDANG